MGILQGSKGNDLEELEHGRPGGGNSVRARTSNCGFANGSARSLTFGKSITPLNLWAITDLWPNAPPLSWECIE